MAVPEAGKCGNPVCPHYTGKSKAREPYSPPRIESSRTLVASGDGVGGAGERVSPFRCCASPDEHALVLEGFSRSVSVCWESERGGVEPLKFVACRSCGVVSARPAVAEDLEARVREMSNAHLSKVVEGATEERPAESVLADIAQVVFTQASDQTASAGGDSAASPGGGVAEEPADCGSDVRAVRGAWSRAAFSASCSQGMRAITHVRGCWRRIERGCVENSARSLLSRCRKPSEEAEQPDLYDTFMEGARREAQSSKRARSSQPASDDVDVSFDDAIPTAAGESLIEKVSEARSSEAPAKDLKPEPPKDTMYTEGVTVDSGKYRFFAPEGDYRIHVHRGGQPWLLIEAGHKAILAMMYELADAREKLAEAQRQLTELQVDAQRGAADDWLYTEGRGGVED
jgi:hypothetical protein